MVVIFFLLSEQRPSVPPRGVVLFMGHSKLHKKPGFWSGNFGNIAQSQIRRVEGLEGRRRAAGKCQKTHRLAGFLGKEYKKPKTKIFLIGAPCRPPPSTPWRLLAHIYIPHSKAPCGGEDFVITVSYSAQVAFLLGSAVLPSPDILIISQTFRFVNTFFEIF